MKPLTDEERQQLLRGCEVILNYVPEQLPNILNALRRAEKGGNFHLPLSIAVDQFLHEVKPNIGHFKTNKNSLGELLIWAKNRSEGGTASLGTPFNLAEPQVELTGATVRAVIEHWERRTRHGGFTHAVETIADEMGVDRATMFRYMDGVPATARKRSRETLMLLARSLHIFDQPAETQDAANDPLA